MTSVENVKLLSGIGRGGFTHARIFWSNFHQVVVPKIVTFSVILAKRCFDVRKKRTKLPEFWGGGDVS